MPDGNPTGQVVAAWVGEMKHTEGSNVKEIKLREFPLAWW